MRSKVNLIIIKEKKKLKTPSHCEPPHSLLDLPLQPVGQWRFAAFVPTRCSKWLLGECGRTLGLAELLAVEGDKLEPRAWGHEGASPASDCLTAER